MRNLPKRIIYAVLLLSFVFFLEKPILSSATPIHGLAKSETAKSFSIQSIGTEKGEKEENISNPQIGPTIYDRAKGILYKVNPPIKNRKEAVGYYAEDWVGDDRSLKAVQKYGDFMTAVAPFAYVIDQNGNLSGRISNSAINAAREKNLGIFMLIHNFINGGFDRDTLSKILNNEKARANLISQIHITIKEKQLAGVNIDLEFLYPHDREKYNQFLKELKSVLQADGFLLTVSVPAKTNNDASNSWSGGFDYEAIGSIADRVMIMTYDEHWFGGSAGPVASLPWVENVLQYSVSKIPKDKLLLGIGIYGYDWSFANSKTKALSSAQAEDKAKKYGSKIQWDSQAQVPYYYYWPNGEKRVVWYESSESAAMKAQLVQKYDIRGIAVWRLGFENGSFWETMRKNMSPIQ